MASRSKPRFEAGIIRPLGPRVSSDEANTPLTLGRTTNKLCKGQIRVLFPFLFEEMKLVLLSFACPPHLWKR